MVLARWKGLMACSSAVLAIGLLSPSQLVADDDDGSLSVCICAHRGSAVFSESRHSAAVPSTSEYTNIIDSINNSDLG